MKIAILTSGRFHALDLARELSNLGHDVTFYSFVPLNRALKFGLPKKCHYNLFFYAAPFLLLIYLSPKIFKNYFERLLIIFFDSVVQSKLKPCDVVIAMSGLFIKSLQYGKVEYNAKIYLERGSKHIVSQKEILDIGVNLGKKVNSVPLFTLKRELAGYEIADKITVPSLHAEKSFIDQGIQANRIFRNPYGVDLAMFSNTQSPPNRGRPTIIYVGNWTYQKGVDVLVKAWKLLGPSVTLLHVGEVGDIDLPDDSGFIHVDPVPQWRLFEYYAMADLFVLASRQDGFGMVLSQALACGLPLVCTDQTGGQDLIEILDKDDCIKIVEADNVSSLALGIQEMLPRAIAANGLRDVLGDDGRELLSWSAYGMRYSSQLQSNN